MILRLTRQIFSSNFFIRLRSWEYWPFGLIQFPLMLYWLWLSIRARSLLFFSASNPRITLGGMFGESKYEVLMQLPQHLRPKTIFAEFPTTVDEVMEKLKRDGLNFPIIFKPDYGERGFMVKRILSRSDVEHYLTKIRSNFLIQELIDLPVECGVFFTRFPNEDKGKVTSVVLKEMLDVVGDGVSTLQELILAKERAKLQWEVLKEAYYDRLGEVITKGERVELISIGNHCLGTKFLDGNHLISPAMSESFDTISKQMAEFYFGRFDLRCASQEDLSKGNVKILEVNGCGAEPAHIYQPGFSLWKAYGTLFKHWKNLYLISRQNQKRGVPFTSFREGRNVYKKYRASMQTGF